MRIRTLLLCTLISQPASAHEIVRDGNVGALLHIEPDDNPVVGKPNPTWFETRARGGKRITLTNCECTLSVYAGSARPDAKPVLTPKLRMDRDRLGADITFPNVGAYTLILTGRPLQGESFNPFKLEWVVRAGSQAGSDH